MINIDNRKLSFNANNNSYKTKVLKLPIKNINIKKNNINNYNAYTKPSNLKNYNLYPNNESFPRKDNSHILNQTTIKSSFYTSKKKIEKNDLDESLDQISQILNNNKKNLNYSGLIGKIPGINEETNFVYDQILFNKKSINKAKILSHKIKVLKLPISNLSTKEDLNTSDSYKKSFSDRVKGNGNTEGNKRNKNMDEDKVSISCCFFSGK